MQMRADNGLASYARYVHAGFVVEIYEHADRFEAWLGYGGYAVKELMFASPKGDVDADEFASRVESHLIDFEAAYRRRNMC